MDYGQSFKEWVIGTIDHTRVIGSTVYGNPIHIVDLANEWSRWTHSYRISDNSMLNYAITNPEYRDKLHVFEVTAAGRLSGRTMNENALILQAFDRDGILTFSRAYDNENEAYYRLDKYGRRGPAQLVNTHGDVVASR